MTLPSLEIRSATTADTAAIRQLHAASLRRLGRGHYPSATLERVLQGGSFQPELLRHGRYEVARLGDRLVGSGGWLDHDRATSPEILGREMNRARRSDTARVRAVYVAPWLARQGIGSSLLSAIEAEMQAAGKTITTLVATRMAVRFFNRRGYAVERPLTVAVAGDRLVEVFAMTKMLQAADSAEALCAERERRASERAAAALPRAA